MKIKKESYIDYSYSINQSFRVRYFSGIASSSIYPHKHEYYGMLFLTCGEIAFKTGCADFILRPGDILFINKNQLHCPVLINSKTPERILLDIYPETLKRLSTDEIDLSACFTHDNFKVYRYPREIQNSIRILLGKLLTIANVQNYGNDLLSSACLTELFVEINQYNHQSMSLWSEDTKDAQLVAMVKQYIAENVERKILVDELSDYFCISRYHFMRKFKKCSGVTVNKFIIKQKLKAAVSMIKAGYSFKDASYQCGFNEYSHFYKAFKNEFRLSPKEYFAVAK